jgi:hypothetical protein
MVLPIISISQLVVVLTVIEELARANHVGMSSPGTVRRFASTLVIHSPPEVVHFAVNLHEHLVEMPSPPAGPHVLNAPLSDLSR